MRQSVQALGDTISDRRMKLGVVQTAHDLDCSVEELVGMKIDCPTDKLGQIIGKNGKKVKELMNKTNVVVDIERRQGAVRVIGTVDAVSEAQANLKSVIDRHQQLLDAPPHLIAYLSSKGIEALKELKERHPDVSFVVKRDANEIPVEGLPEDIASFARDLATLSVEQKTIVVASSALPAVIGRKGSVIEQLVAAHQATIQVVGGNSEKSDGDDATITVSGPVANIEAALEDIQSIIDREEVREESIRLDPVVQKYLSVRSTPGLQSLYTALNEATEPAIPTDKCTVSFAENTCKIKGKRKYMLKAIEAAEKLFQDLESAVVRISVDPDRVGRILGKGGENIKALTAKYPQVVLSVSKDEISILGQNKGDAESLRDSLSEIIAKNAVRRFQIDRPVGSFMNVFVKLLAAIKAAGFDESVTCTPLKESTTILVRGEVSDLERVASLLEGVLDENCFSKLPIDEEDIRAVLVGGKSSKLVEIEREKSVLMHLDQKKCILEVSGTKDAVGSAISELKAFLYGCDDFAVEKIPIQKKSVPIIVGRKGARKKEMEEEHGVVLTISSDDAFVTLRGPRDKIDLCRIEIKKSILKARQSESVPLSPEEYKVVKGSRIIHRAIKPLGVQVEEKENELILVGAHSDICYAKDLLAEAVSGTYRSHVYLGEEIFTRVEKGQDPSFLKHIEDTSGASISFLADQKAVVIAGSKDKVIRTKDHFYRFLSFFLSSGICRMDVDGLGVTRMVKNGLIAEAIAKTDCNILLDRDVKAIILLGKNEQQTEEARKMLESEVTAAANLVSKVQLDESEDWLLSSFIGPKGRKVKVVRQDAKNCTIDVDPDLRTITISSEKEENVAEGRSLVERVLQELRDTNAFVTLSAAELPSFIGKKGKNIKEFRQRMNVQIDVLPDDRLHLTGDKDELEKAQSEIMEWLQKREEERKEAAALLTLHVERENIPVVIGTKGETVNSLQKEFGCRIDIDRESCLVTIRGRSAENRQSVRDKIETILSQKDEKEQLGSEPACEQGIQEVSNAGEPGIETKNNDAKIEAQEGDAKTSDGVLRPSLSFEEMVSKCDWDADASNNVDDADGDNVVVSK